MKTVPLGDLATEQGQYGMGLSSREWRKGDPRYIRITDIRDDGSLNPTFVAPDGEPTEWERALLSKDDLLFARSGATVGKTYIHPEDAPPSVYAGYLIRFRVDRNRVLPRYVFHYTRSSAYRSWVTSSQRAVAQPNINAKQYASLRIPLPALDEQRRIVRILDQADALRTVRQRSIKLFDGLGLGLAIFLDMFGDPESVGQPSVRFGEVADLQGGRNLVADDDAAVSSYRVLKISAVTTGTFKPAESKPLPVTVITRRLNHIW